MSSGKTFAVRFAWLAGAFLLTGCASDRWEDRGRAYSDRQIASFQKESKQRLGRKGGGTSAGGWWTSLWDRTLGTSPAEAQRKLEDIGSPDARREAIFYFADRGYGREEPYTSRYAQIASHLEPGTAQPAKIDPTVRAAALRALNRSRATRHLAVFRASLRDPSPLVRLEAAKALANMPDPQAASDLTQVATNPDEPRDVRIAAADALRLERTIAAAQALIDLLQPRDVASGAGLERRSVIDNDFGVAVQARRSLVVMTGKDFRYDRVAWLEYLSSTPRPFAD